MTSAPSFLISGGRVVTKGTDMVVWSGTTSQFDGRALDILGRWSSYSYIYRNSLWVAAAVNKIAGATARLPLKVYRRTSDSREDARDSPYGLLLQRPSKTVDPVSFWKWVRSILDIYGESFLGKVRDGVGRPVELIPLHPVYVKYDENTDEWSYDNGKTRIERIPRRDLVHFKHFSPDSVRGMSPLEPLRQTLDSEDGVRRGHASTFRNGGRPSVMLQHPKLLSEPAAQRLLIQWNEIHSGVDNWSKAALLEEGMTATTLPVNFEQLQYIEVRRLNREEVCAGYDIPPPALHILDHATYSNITEQNRALYRDTMAPKLADLESTLEMELRDGSMGTNNPPDFDDDVYAEFLLDEVLRGAFEARAQAYQQSDFMTIAEKRQKENLPFIPGTDRIFLNSASLPLGPDGQLEQPEPATPPALPEPQLALPAPKKTLDAATVRTLMGRMSRVTDIGTIQPTEFVSGLGEGTAQILKTLAEAVDAEETVDELKTRLKNVTLPDASDGPQTPVFISHTVNNVNPEKELPPTVVENHNHIEPTQVNVEAAQVNLPPMQVNLPAPTAMRRTVERDENGRIVAIIDTPVPA